MTVDELARRLAAVEAKLNGLSGPMVSANAGSLNIRPYQVGFPAKLTSTYDAETGYDWEQLVLDPATASIVAQTYPLTGDGAVETTGRTDLAVDDVVWLEVDPQAGGYIFTAGGGTGGTITVEAVDGSPSITGVTTLRFDEADGFSLSTPGAGIARVDFTQTLLTVKEVPPGTTVSSVTELQFAGYDGLRVSSPSAGKALVELDGDTFSTWTPTATGLTTVGSVSLAGDYYVPPAPRSQIIKFQVRIGTTAGGTSASVAGTTYIDNFPFNILAIDVCYVANYTSGVGLGTGAIQSGAFAGNPGRIYLPSWVATSDFIIVSGVAKC